MKFDLIYKVILTLGVVSLLMGSLIKIMHWPNSFNFLMIGYLTIMLIYPRIILQQKKRSKLAIFRAIAIMCWGGFNILYLIYYPENKNTFNILAKLSLFSWGALYLYQYFMDEKERTSLKSRLMTYIFIFGSLFTATGMIFKILHMPFASLFMIIGLSSTGIWIIASAFLDINEDKLV